MWKMYLRIQSTCLQALCAYEWMDGFQLLIYVTKAVAPHERKGAKEVATGNQKIILCVVTVYIL